jgi:hypothetical protein
MLLRRMVLIAVAVAAAGAGAACSVSPVVPARWSTPAGDPSGSTTAVCARIRSDLRARMGTIGAAMGKMVGADNADDHDDARTARASITAQLNAMASELSQAGAAADDSAFQAAATQAARSVSALASDSTYVSGIDSLADVPPAINKISVAVQPIADACR